MPCEISVAEMKARYDGIRSANIYDTLDRLGIPNQCMDLSIRPLRWEMHVAGPALPIYGTREPRLEDELDRPQFKDWGQSKAMTPHCVVVVNAEKESTAGHWGEMMSWTAKQHGASGIVIDGGTRDRMGILEIPDWPCFCRYTTPVESAKRWRVVDFRVPIFVSGTLTRLIRVNPGDWIVGDADGVMVIPKEMAYEVLIKAEHLEARERGQRADLLAGLLITEVYKKYGRM